MFNATEILQKSFLDFCSIQIERNGENVHKTWQTLNATKRINPLKASELQRPYVHKRFGPKELVVGVKERGCTM